MILRSMNVPVLIASALIIASSNAFAFSDQTTTERILKENKRFLEFINTCTSNFAADKKEDLRKAFEKYFNADVAYLQSDYRRAYKRVYSSQGEMEKLYRELVKNYYLEDSKAILDRLAPSIIRSKNNRARLYLTLGYRDRTVSWVHYTVGDASNPKLYSYKLYKYEDAIKMSRRAKRFAFLALFESQTLETKRKIYNQVCKSERDMNNRFMNRFVDLNDQAYINEIDRTYLDYQKTEDAAAQSRPKKEGGFSSAVDMEYEAKVVRRVRFRNETRTARYLINSEFDKAEDILREYIDDFNFKLIYATFDVLAGTGSEAGAAEKTSAEKVDYKKFKIHLLDNYARFSGKSLLDELIPTLKVEDDVPDRDAEQEGSENVSGRETGKDDAVKTDKKDDKPVKTGGNKKDETPVKAEGSK